MSTPQETAALGNILIADDDALSLATTEGHLRGLGYRCLCVTDGHAALEALARESFDLLVSDICMPGNPALEMVKKVPGLAPGMPVILLTGNPSAQTAIDSLHLPVMAYLIKPFKAAELEALVKRGVEYRRLTQAGQQMFQRMGEWSRQAEAMRQYLAASSNSSRLLDVNQFMALSVGNMMNAMLDMQGLVQAARTGESAMLACSVGDCPKLREYHALAAETVRILEESKQYARSKALSGLRKSWENLLREEKPT